MNTNVLKKNSKNLEVIPVFFATDDNYIPFLDVAICSLIENSSKKYFYDIHVLNTGLKLENMFKVKLRQSANVSITFDNISKNIEKISENFRNIYHFSLAAYYRLFIESMFPQFKKILYLDCDIVVLGDVSKLWQIDLGDNMLGGVVEGFVAGTKEFREYAQKAVGINPDRYINSGILSINLEKFRENKIEEKFRYLLSTFNFDTIDPDQMYLNYLCKDKILYLPCDWNFTAAYEKPVEKINIVHYALAKKPWQFDNVTNDKYFWKYTKKSHFYKKILSIKEEFGDEAKAKKEQAGIDIVRRAIEIVSSGKTFCNTLSGGE